MRRLVLPFILLLSLVLPATALAQQAAPCQFILGFKTLHDLDAADIGDCIENQGFKPNGDAQQHTTKGLMAWRKADNWTAFTNGYKTWLNGPNGLVSRLNTETFPWEAAAPLALSVPPVASGATAWPAKSASRAQVRQYSDAIAAKVDRYWQAQSAVLHFTYTKPTIKYTVDGNESGPCDGTHMFDDSTDTVCLDLSSDIGDDSFTENVAAGQPDIVAYTIGHEWGHHIQLQRRQESTQDVDINIELQADCYSGMFLKTFSADGSFTPTGLTDILEDAYGSGDDPAAPISEHDHGTPAQRKNAVQTGFNGNAATTCDPLGTKTPQG